MVKVKKKMGKFVGVQNLHFRRVADAAEFPGKWKSGAI
jgi:hypothetical protein